eukprot:jgi/Hompol1/3551/HPOL_006608-RA
MDMADAALPDGDGGSHGSACPVPGRLSASMPPLLDIPLLELPESVVEFIETQAAKPAATTTTEPAPALAAADHSMAAQLELKQHQEPQGLAASDLSSVDNVLRVDGIPHDIALCVCHKHAVRARQRKASRHQGILKTSRRSLFFMPQ